MKPMTVRELRAWLEEAQVTDDMVVLADGCDCVEAAVGIYVNWDDNSVTVARVLRDDKRIEHEGLPQKTYPLNITTLEDI